MTEQEEIAMLKSILSKAKPVQFNSLTIEEQRYLEDLRRSGWSG